MTLDIATLRRLESYKPEIYTRNGIDLNTPINLTQAACWSWALAGTFVSANDPMTPQNVQESIFPIDLSEFARDNAVVTPNSFVDRSNDFAGTSAYFNNIASSFNAARAGNRAAQMVVSNSYVRIMARIWGLSPNYNDNSVYTLHMRTGPKEWYGWHHWGIGIKLKSGTRMIIQTVTNVPVSFCSNTMWDESLVETVIGIDNLLATHANFLVNTPRANFNQGRCVSAGMQCSDRGPATVLSCATCGTAYCEFHGLQLNGNDAHLATKNVVRKCNQPGCLGYTTLIP